MAKAAKRHSVRKHSAPIAKVSIAEFVRNPAPSYAKMQSGKRLVLTGEDASTRIVMYPGTLADYGSAK